MHRRRHEDAFARLGRRLKHRVRELLARRRVHEAVIAAARRDGEAGVRNASGKLVCMNARRIHHGARMHTAAVGKRQHVSVAFGGTLDALDARRKTKLHVVRSGVFGGTPRHLVRVADAARRRQQGADRFRGDVRLQIAQLDGVDHTQPLDAVALAALRQRAHGLQFVIRERQDDRSVLLIGKSQFGCPLGV